jgi:uncharacterized membrane protein YczE
MCFSPVASFATAALTGSIGAVCLARATRSRELPLAATPLIFGVQQAIEGGLWLTLPTAPNGAVVGALTLAFLLFAQVFWPVYAPLAAWSLEPNAWRRRLMLACLAVGAGVAAYLLWRILAGPREAMVVNSCIVYRTRQGHPLAIGLAYLAATSLPLVLSSQRTILALGAVTLVGCVVAYIFYWAAFLSVWCFFAAAASIVILGYFEHARWRSLLPAAT